MKQQEIDALNHDDLFRRVGDTTPIRVIEISGEKFGRFCVTGPESVITKPLKDLEGKFERLVGAPI